MDQPTGHAIRIILLATDFSPPAEQARLVAEDLAEHFGARLHVLHVVRASSQREGALLQLARLSGPGREVVNAVEVGKASHAIVAYAREAQADVIVMGSHGRTRLQQAFGSITQTVIRSAPCQVLAVTLQAESAATTPAPAPAPAPERVAALAVTPRCLLCVRPSDESICSPCKARVEGEARERRRRELRELHTKR